MKLISIEKKSFESKVTGKVVDGYDLAVAVPDQKFGERCEVVFVREGVIGDKIPHVGQDVIFQMNEYGKVRAVRAL